MISCKSLYWAIIFISGAGPGDSAASNGHAAIVDNPLYETTGETDIERKWDNPIYGVPDKDIDSYDTEVNKTETEEVYASIDT